MSSNKFIKTITASNKDIKGKRAELIAEDVMAAQNKLVEDLRDQKRTLMRKQMDLEDLAPDSAFSMSPTKAGFDAKNWVTEMQAVKISLIEIEVRLQCAEATNSDYFSSTDEKA